MNPVKVLLIAPYTGMAEMAEQISKKRTDLILDTRVGDLEEGVSLASEINRSDYDFIISRGGTAELLTKTLRIPVLHIRLSEYDMLRALLLAKNCNEPYAVVGFRDITECVDLVSALLDVSIPTRTLRVGDDVHPYLLSLKESGITLVVGDNITVTTAREMGLNTILITSGEESISAAFDTAVQTKRAQMEADARCDVLYEVLNHCALDFVTFNEDGEVVHQKCRLLDSKKLISLTSRYLRQLKKNGNFELSTKCGDAFVRLDGYTWQSEETLYVFYCKINDAQNAKNVVLMQRPEENLWTDFIHFYSNCDNMKPLMNLTATLTRTTIPVLISGESGSLTECFVWELYQNCAFHASPCFMIDCSTLTSKTLHFLVEHINSPLYNNNIVIYLRDIHLLDQEKQELLLTYIQNTSLNTRNRVIYSMCPSCTDNRISAYLLGCTPCQLLSLPPLRNRHDEMRSLAGIYLNEINMRFGRQMLGVQPDAIDLLAKYSWPQNITQFVRVLTASALSSQNPFIELSSIQNSLHQEALTAYEHTGSFQLPDGTLDEIMHSIVTQVLKEEDMNQSRTAKRLGISRSTLWRMLK